MPVSTASNQEVLPQMSDTAIFLWQNLIEEKTGLWLPLNRKMFLLTQLKNRLRAKGFNHYIEYYDWLMQNGNNKQEWATLIDLLTVHETRFFRDKSALNLVGKFMKDLIQGRNSQNSPLRSDAVKKILTQTRVPSANIVQVWSVGCSTGEEVYSLAMILQEIAEQHQNPHPFHFRVTGTDISFPSLAIARDGSYQRRNSLNIPKEFRQKYTSEIDDNFLIEKKLQEKDCFMQGNLRELESMPAQVFDLIYCQNVLIYFKPERKKRLLDQLVDRLSNGGMLILAPGEATNWQHPEMKKHANTECHAYLKKTDQTDNLRGEYVRK